MQVIPPASHRPPLQLLISADSHVLEPPDLWETRIDEQFRDRAPRVVAEDDGDQWYADGGKFPMGNIGTVGAAGVRFDDVRRIHIRGRLASLPAGGFDPAARLEEMDRDGVAIDVLYPSVAMHCYRIQDSRLVSAIMRAYNDWIAEFCSAAPRRLKGVALVNVDDVGEAVMTLTQAARRGMAGAIIPVSPTVEYSHPSYEPLWSAAEELALPLSLHVGTPRWRPGIATIKDHRNAPLVIINRDLEVREPLALMIMHGIFERHPNLRVVCLEYESSWVPHFLFRMDDCYTQRHQGLSGHRFKGGALPSDFFRKHVSVSFQEDPHCARDASLIGAGCLMWGSDYPHAESTFPHSREILGKLLAGLDPDTQAAMTGLNAARLYRLDLSGS